MRIHYGYALIDHADLYKTHTHTQRILHVVYAYAVRSNRTTRFGWIRQAERTADTCVSIFKPVYLPRIRRGYAAYPQRMADTQVLRGYAADPLRVQPA